MSASISTFVAPDAEDEVRQEQLAGAVKRYCESTGKSFIVLKNPWWGNKKFNVWEKQFIVDVERVSHDDETGEVSALLLKNVETLDRIHKAVRDRERIIDNIMENRIEEHEHTDGASR